MKHLHHIVPKHLGGTDEPENLVELTIEEHAEAHRQLYEQHGRWEDYLAWQGLSGLMDREQLVIQMLSEAGKKGAAKTNAMKTKKRGPKPGKFKPVGTGGTKWYHNPANPTERTCIRNEADVPKGWIKGKGSVMTGAKLGSTCVE